MRRWLSFFMEKMAVTQFCFKIFFLTISRAFFIDNNFKIKKNIIVL